MLFRMPQIALDPDLCCPITTELFVDPVHTCDGHTYERAAICKWFESKSTSPKTNLVLRTKELAPGVSMKQTIEKWKIHNKIIPIDAFIALVTSGDVKTLDSVTCLPNYILDSRVFDAAVKFNQVRVFDSRCDGETQNGEI